MMMQASHFRQDHHLTHFWRLDSSGVGTIHFEGKMGTKSVIIGDIRREHPLKMPCVEHDDMIE
jgi:hypothetical protein